VGRLAAGGVVRSVSAGDGWRHYWNVGSVVTFIQTLRFLVGAMFRFRGTAGLSFFRSAGPAGDRSAGEPGVRVR
jgi:hypothetical protein